MQDFGSIWLTAEQREYLCAELWNMVDAQAMVTDDAARFRAHRAAWHVIELLDWRYGEGVWPDEHDLRLAVDEQAVELRDVLDDVCSGYEESIQDDMENGAVFDDADEWLRQTRALRYVIDSLDAVLVGV